MRHHALRYVRALSLMLIGSGVSTVEALDIRDLEILAASRACTSCNLIRADRSGADLTGSDLNKV